MKITDQYIRYTKSVAQADPQKGWERIKLGFQANCLKTAMLPNKKVAKGYQKLEDMMMRFVARSLSHEERYIWGNIGLLYFYRFFRWKTLKFIGFSDGKISFRIKITKAQVLFQVNL